MDPFDEGDDSVEDDEEEITDEDEEVQEPEEVPAESEAEVSYLLLLDAKLCWCIQTSAHSVLT